MKQLYSNKDLLKKKKSTTSTPSTEILVSNTILQQKETGLLGEMGGSRTGTGNTQDEPGASYSVRK